MPGNPLPNISLDAPPARPGQNLFGLSRQELRALMVGLGEPVFRAGQLLEAMYRQHAVSLDSITVLPARLREQMAKDGWTISRPQIVAVFRSSDGTERYLVQGDAGHTVETVWMPGGDGGEQGDLVCDDSDPALTGFDELEGPARDARSPLRATICVSSQIGCAVNCQFCLTAKLGLQRNLSAGEIAGQVVAVLDRHGAVVGRDRINLVFMGMGEPFLNYDEFMAAVRLLVEEAGLAESRMTVSTSGIVPGILRFADEPVRPKLAISLNAANDTVREAIMPVTRKWKIDDLLSAAAKLRLRPRERVTFEYVLLGGVNDRLQDADQLISIARRAAIPVKINLIAWNPGPGIAYAPPEPAQVEAFQRRLIQSGVPAFLRRPRGQDIFAACGQLKRTTE
jgi:23S rRNA (adenine2503-C2)-methyltransferase